MLTDRIIGRVGADILAKRISNPDQPGDSAALFGSISFRRARLRL
ncbi:hypothetical protein AAFM48_08245 [Burkholderia pseudomallei]